MFSIIIPIYNVEDYLRECLDSILNQSEGMSLEVLLIDDGSKDSSGAIAKEYEKNYPDIFKYYIKENGGLSDARNYGIPYASKEYTFFIDSDDYLTDDALAVLKEVVDNEHPDVITFNYIKIWSDHKEDVKDISNDSGFITNNEYLMLNPAAWNKVIKTSILKESNILFPKGLWYEDRATTGSYVNYCHAIYYCNEYLYMYRQRENSIMLQTKYNPKMMDILTAMKMFNGQVSDTSYKEEKEYLNISNLIFQNSLRLLPHKRKDELKECISYINSVYPDWTNNKYFMQQSKGYKMLCKFINLRMFTIAKLIIRIRH